MGIPGFDLRIRDFINGDDHFPFALPLFRLSVRLRDNGFHEFIFILPQMIHLLHELFHPDTQHGITWYSCNKAKKKSEQIAKDLSERGIKPFNRKVPSENPKNFGWD